MVWSGKHPGAVEKIETLRNHGSIAIDPPNGFIEDCGNLEDECWNQLEELAENLYPHPIDDVGYGNEARRLVQTAIDEPDSNYDTGPLEELFDQHSSNIENRTQKLICRQAIGLIVLKNGDEMKDSNRLEWLRSYFSRSS